MAASVEKAKEIAASIPGAFIPNQFSNPANPLIHEKTTGPEIWNDTKGKIDILVCGVGTGGTITGAGKYLKSKKSSIKIIAVEPLASPVLSGGEPGVHSIQGIGAGFIPEVLDRSIIDEIIQVGDKEAAIMTRNLARLEGIFAGISSGAALEAALAITRRSGSASKTIVVILPDSGDRYMSTPLWE